MRLAKHHIRSWYARATAGERSDGHRWYGVAFAECLTISVETGTPVNVVAAVLAAVSPRNRWERNVQDARNLCAYAANGFVGATPKCATFSCNVANALRILDGEEPLNVLTSRKVRSFYRCIIGEDDVCIDTWAIRAATNGKVSTVPNDGVYRKVQEAYRAVAKELGIEAKVLQAICWVAIRNAS